ncbi:MAG: hypothetical protein BWY83_01690 [bacterium ADurb.Bin478]|nr:MAG: hypothetical protein BWY83_01690 [bacterium ADurb.Bin478]
MKRAVFQVEIGDAEPAGRNQHFIKFIQDGRDVGDVVQGEEGEEQVETILRKRILEQIDLHDAQILVQTGSGDLGIRDREHARGGVGEDDAADPGLEGEAEQSGSGAVFKTVHHVIQGHKSGDGIGDSTGALYADRVIVPGAGAGIKIVHLFPSDFHFPMQAVTTKNKCLREQSRTHPLHEMSHWRQRSQQRCQNSY